jgi:hypothetical protein
MEVQIDWRIEDKAIQIIHDSLDFLHGFFSLRNIINSLGLHTY